MPSQVLTLLYQVTTEGSVAACHKILRIASEGMTDYMYSPFWLGDRQCVQDPADFNTS